MKKIHREPVPYTIRFVADGDTYWDYTVRAYSLSEAIAQAKYEAGVDGVPILECRVEVT